MKLLEGKRGIVFGVANKRSIAWGIAQALSGAGMTLAFAYQGERLKESVAKLVADLDYDAPLYDCDVTSDDQIAGVFAMIEKDFGSLDTVIHSVAFAPREDLEREFYKTSREGFLMAHDISAYSLIAITREALPLLEKSDNASVMAMTYYGAERVARGYNVMGVAKASLEASIRYLASELGEKGIRVNAISAGPVNTLAARGIKGFTKMLSHHAELAPMKRNIETREVSDTALFLASPMSSGITGEIMFVDCGYNIMAV